MNTYGGKRPGSGRPKDKEPMKYIYFRVPVRVAEEIREETKKIIEKLREI